MARNGRHLDQTMALGMIVPGIMLTILGPQFDGFVKGVCQGAGIALILLGVALLGARLRKPTTSDDDSLWLPSRDGERGEPDR